jgi:hypothetical protein
LNDDRSARLGLAAGAALGIVLAAVGIVTSGGEGADLPAGAVAVVNGHPIARESFARFAAAVAAERKVLTLDAETRHRLLERMLDEELLLQRGIELGLHRAEPTARGSIVSALVASVTADAELAEPEESELRAFHAENEALFRRPERVSLAVVFVSGDGQPDVTAFERARKLEEQLRAGAAFESVRAQADEPALRLPRGPLPLETVREYLGPTVARAAAGLDTGEVSVPLRSGSGYQVLLMRERIPGATASFDEMRAQVRAEVLRSRGDQALRDYLLELRESADLRIEESERATP